MLESLNLSGTPPVPVPRSFSWSTAMTNHLLRTGTCASTTTFDNTYSVRNVGADVFLDVRQNTIMFTFKRF